MDSNQTNFGKLSLNYVSDENSYHCSCVCGNKVILTKEQLESMNSCGCESRKLLWTACGKSSDEFEFNTKQPTAATVGYSDERGVRFEKGKNKWRVRITFQSKEYHLGYYSEKETAMKIKHEAESHLNSDFIEWYNNVYKAN